MMVRSNHAIKFAHKFHLNSTHYQKLQVMPIIFSSKRMDSSLCNVFEISGSKDCGQGRRDTSISQIITYNEALKGYNSNRSRLKKHYFNTTRKNIIFNNTAKNTIFRRKFKLFISKLVANKKVTLAPSLIPIVGTTNSDSRNEVQTFKSTITNRKNLKVKSNNSDVNWWTSIFSPNNNNKLTASFGISNLEKQLLSLMSSAIAIIRTLFIIFVQLKIPLLFAYIIHSQTPSSAHSTSKCLQTDAETCFRELFDNIQNICTEIESHLQCKHYNYLDECFKKSNLECQPLIVGRAAKNAFKKKQRSCQQSQYRKSTNRHHQSKSAMLKHQTITELQFISYIGYLQAECNSQASTNCTIESYRESSTKCEERIKKSENGSPKEANRHHLLRMKLQASSNLMEFTETRRKEECLIVRGALSDIFSLHQQYCLQSNVTKCMCERLNFRYFCNIECDKLEASGLPFDQQLEWTLFEGRLKAGSESSKLKSIIPFKYYWFIICTYLYFFI